MQTDSIASTGEAPGEFLTLSEIARIAPGRPSTGCVWRWCRRGILARDGRRVRLRHVRLGNRLFSTRSWLEAFGRELAQADARHFDSTNPSDAASGSDERTDDRHAMTLDRIEAELDEAGL